MAFTLERAKTSLVFTDIQVDLTGDIAAAVAVKCAERAGLGRARRRRPPDVAFDEALLAELARRRVRFGLNKACIAAAVDVAASLGWAISAETARQRIVRLLRRGHELHRNFLT
jgi:hypothetical protein